MMKKTTAFTLRRGRALIAVAIGLVLIGLIVVTASVGFEWRGFGGGFAMGAGIGAMLVGAYFWGWTTGLRRSAPAASWLPGEDAGR